MLRPESAVPKSLEIATARKDDATYGRLAQAVAGRAVVVRVRSWA